MVNVYKTQNSAKCFLGLGDHGFGRLRGAGWVGGHSDIYIKEISVRGTQELTLRHYNFFLILFPCKKENKITRTLLKKYRRSLSQSQVITHFQTKLL